MMTQAAVKVGPQGVRVKEPSRARKKTSGTSRVFQSTIATLDCGSDGVHGRGAPVTSLSPVSPDKDQTSYIEPPKGSPLRFAVLDGVRPLAEREFGAPIDFVVGALRVADAVAYVSLKAQRPGGADIVPEATPMYRNGRWDSDGKDLRVVSGFLRLTNGAWQPYDVIFGASEAWWIGNCIGLEKLMPQTCPNTKQAVSESKPLGETADLYNIFDHLLRSDCGASCAFSSVNGQYKATRMSVAALPPRDILKMCEMYYEQGTNVCHPPSDFLYDMRADDLSAARERGWTPMESIVNDNMIAGDTAATRFAAQDGRQVLAFRGSVTAGDWFTNTCFRSNARERGTRRNRKSDAWRAA